jgi:hypothetical protein
MSIENVTYAFQVAATNGNGFSVFFRDANFVTFRVTGNGPVTAGQLAIEYCPQATPKAPGSGSGGAMIWNRERASKSFSYLSRKIGRDCARLVHESPNSIHTLRSPFAWTVCLRFTLNWLLCHFTGASAQSATGRRLSRRQYG